MPINNIPFTSFQNNARRPNLLVNIINPHTNQCFKTSGIIDTGADECAVPAAVASLLGHDLQKGVTKQIYTGNGLTIAYKHTTKFEIYHPITKKLLYTIQETPVDFMPNLPMLLLGCNNFLSKFVLCVDYPQQTFSIKYS